MVIIYLHVHHLEHLLKININNIIVLKILLMYLNYIIFLTNPLVLIDL